MTIRDMLSPENQEKFDALLCNDVMVKAWHSSVNNPLAPLPQTVDTLFWLIELLIAAKDSAFTEMFLQKLKDA